MFGRAPVPSALPMSSPVVSCAMVQASDTLSEMKLAFKQKIIILPPFESAICRPTAELVLTL